MALNRRAQAYRVFLVSFHLAADLIVPTQLHIARALRLAYSVLEGDECKRVGVIVSPTACLLCFLESRFVRLKIHLSGASMTAMEMLRTRLEREQSTS